MPENMKSVMVFKSSDSKETQWIKFNDWLRRNKSAVADRNIPNADETRRLLDGKL